MNVPETLPLDAGGAACVNVIGSKVLLVVPKAGAVLTRAECEYPVPQPWQDRFIERLWRARVWLRARR